MSLVSALAQSDAKGIMAFIRSRQSKWGATWLLVMWHHWHWCQHYTMLMASSHLLGQDIRNEYNVTYLVMWSHWHWCHMVLMLSSIALLSSLGWGIQIEMQYDFLVMWFLWHKHYMLPMVSPVAPLHSLGQDDWNDVHHDFFDHVMPVVAPMAPLHFFGHDNQIEMQHDMALLVSCGSYVNLTSSKGHIIHLNHHINITNAMVSLMAPPTSCYCHVHDKN